MPQGLWPWTTEIDADKGLFYGPELCGSIEYDVFYSNGGYKEPTSLVEITPNYELVLKPTVNDPISQYTMLLCGRLSNYRDVEVC